MTLPKNSSPSPSPEWVTYCFLQGRNSQTEEWKTLDNIDGNRQNVVSRMIDTPAQVRYVRLMITRPMQHAGGKVLRINEMEIY